MDLVLGLVFVAVPSTTQAPLVLNTNTPHNGQPSNRSKPAPASVRVGALARSVIVCLYVAACAVRDVCLGWASSWGDWCAVWRAVWTPDQS